MKSISNSTRTKSNRYSRKSRTIIFCFIMSLGIIFFSYLAVATFLRGSEDLNELTHVTGAINRIRIMKHMVVSKSGTKYKDIIVLRINGSNDEFGFMDNKVNFEKLLSLPKEGETLNANIYYDKYRKRIEQNVTLHTFELTINGEKYVDIKQIRRTEFTGSIIFSLLALTLTVFTFLGVKTYK